MHRNSLCEICKSVGANKVVKVSWLDCYGFMFDKDMRICWQKTCSEKVRVNNEEKGSDLI